MADVDAAAVNRVREWVGGGVDEAIILAALPTVDTADLAALSILRFIRATAVTGGPLNFAVAGDYSQDAASQLKALDGFIDQLESICGLAVSSLPTVSVGQIARPGRGR